jgi:hypothetical protein
MTRPPVWQNMFTTNIPSQKTNTKRWQTKYHLLKKYNTKNIFLSFLKSITERSGEVVGKCSHNFITARPRFESHHIFEVALDECWSEWSLSGRSLSLPFHVTEPRSGLITLADEFLEELMSSSVDGSIPSKPWLSSPPPLAKILSTVSWVTFVAARCLFVVLYCCYSSSF